MDLLEALKENWSAVAAAPWAFVIIVAIVAFVIWVALTWAYETRLKQRDDNIASLKDKATERETLITALNGMISLLTTERDEARSERHARVAALEVEIKARDEKINALEDEGIGRFAQVMDVTAELKKVRGELEEVSKTAVLRVVDGKPNPFAKKIELFAEQSRAKKPAAAKRTLAELQQALAPRRLDDEQKNTIRFGLNGLGGRVDIVTASNADEPEGLRDDLREVFDGAGWRVEAMTSMSADPSPAGLQLVVRDPKSPTLMETRVHEALSAARVPHALIRAMTSVEAEIRIVKRA